MLRAAPQTEQDQADALMTLSEVETSLGSSAAALARRQEAEGLYAKAAGPRSELVARAAVGVGESLRALGKRQAAREAFELALAICTEHTCASPASTTASTRLGLAHVFVEEGQVARAAPLAARALEELERLPSRAVYQRKIDDARALVARLAR